MKRDLIYLTLLAALFAAAKVMAQNDGATSRQGLTPRTIEVGFTKTVHILFPASVTYIDIGSMAIIAGKADGAENVVRVKAAVRDFAEETNLTVITEDGGFYTFDARYAENPTTSTIEIAAAESPAAQPASASEPVRADEGRVLLREVGRERPATVKRVLSDIYRQNRADVKGIHTRKYGVEVEVRGIYVHNDVIYLHVQIANNSNISFEVDYRRFVVADRKAAKRTAQQQRIIEPLRVCNDPSIVRGHQRQRIVFALPKLTLEEEKILLLEIAEKDGARHQCLEISSKELLGAKAL
ncbi:conjugative transposon protein TraN [uncultured Alistipes sp.]|uniref:conjugative transposon protein TraN n=1 Tax=uncultured Alistipes sp. TaxID=538949 RepID=UPI002607A322|nr:conjugative transposon protein TraN [uncultured Alistipes sp.]